MKIVSTVVDVHDETHAQVTFNYNHITNGIYVGNNQCCHIGLDMLLKKEGIYSVVSLEENVVDNPIGVKSFLWLPIIDHTAPDKEQVILGVNFIDEIINMNKKVYVHCKNGHGRAPTIIVIAYLMLKKHISFENAFALVKQQRPVIHLDQIQKDFLLSI